MPLEEEIPQIIQPVVKQVYLWLGGFFGLYLILVLYKIFSSISLNHRIKDINNKIRGINTKLDDIINKRKFSPKNVSHKKASKAVKKKKNK